MNSVTTSRDQEMYGCNFQVFLDSIKTSITYKFSGANMVVAGLMSDAQEQMAFGDTEGAREVLQELIQRASGPLKDRAQAMLNQLL